MRTISNTARLSRAIISANVRRKWAVWRAGQSINARHYRYGPVMAEPGPAPKVMLGDKGYDADAILAELDARGVAAVIPPKRNRKVQPAIDGNTYALRNLVERCFSKLKHSRRRPPDTTRQRTAISASYSSPQPDCGSGTSSTEPSTDHNYVGRSVSHLCLRF